MKTNLVVYYWQLQLATVKKKKNIYSVKNFRTVELYDINANTT
jgi:hypothetical protein